MFYEKQQNNALNDSCQNLTASLSLHHLLERWLSSTLAHPQATSSCNNHAPDFNNTNHIVIRCFCPLGSKEHWFGIYIFRAFQFRWSPSCVVSKPNICLALENKTEVLQSFAFWMTSNHKRALFSFANGLVWMNT